MEELAGFHPRLWMARLLLAPLPAYTGSRLRVWILRFAGFTIGHGTTMSGTPELVGNGNLYRRLTIGRGCYFNVGCFLDLTEPIRIGDGVSLGQQVMLLTSTHRLGNAQQRAGELVAQPIQIGNGAWLGARCTVLPGITVGEGAVVAAAAVVTKDVPPHTLVGGVPAKPLRRLSEP